MKALKILLFIFVSNSIYGNDIDLTILRFLDPGARAVSLSFHCKKKNCEITQKHNHDILINFKGEHKRFNKIISLIKNLKLQSGKNKITDEKRSLLATLKIDGKTTSYSYDSKKLNTNKDLIAIETKLLDQVEIEKIRRSLLK